MCYGYNKSFHFYVQVLKTQVTDEIFYQTHQNLVKHYQRFIFLVQIDYPYYWK